MIIGIAAVLTAIATYQGGQVDGEVGQNSTEAVAQLLLANDAFVRADSQEAIERDWLFGWITEFNNGTPAAEYLETAMPDEVFDLADEWRNAPDDIADPFSPEAGDAYEAHAGLLSNELRTEGDMYDEAAACAIFAAQVAELRGDDYGLSTVFLAIALVVGGIAALLRRKAAQVIVLVTSTVALLLGAVLLAVAADEVEARTMTAVDFFEDDDELSRDEAIAIADEQCPG